MQNGMNYKPVYWKRKQEWRYSIFKKCVWSCVQSKDSYIVTFTEEIFEVILGEEFPYE